jgi:hypothetical protein
MTDESEQSYPFTIDSLLDKALGPEGYYGVFTANCHSDNVDSSESDYIVASAQARGVPVISARQMLDWLNGRNNSTLSSLSWNGSVLNFTVTVAQGGRGLEVLVPLSTGHSIASISHNGSSVSFTLKTIKGIQYAAFPAALGNYQVVFQP